MERLLIQWTDTAKKCLAKLPRSVRRGLLDEAAKLQEVNSIESSFKALAGPLRAFYHFNFQHYRAVYSLKKDELPDGNIIWFMYVRFIVTGKRSEGSKQDIYKIAEKLLGMIEPGIELQGVSDMRSSLDGESDSAF